MEVWALYAYGAASILQEMITIKSDDVVGRVKVYEALVKGLPIPKSGVPESFMVLIKEFQALGLDITILNKDGNYLELKELEAMERDSFLTTDEFEKSADSELEEAKPTEETDSQVDDKETTDDEETDEQEQDDKEVEEGVLE